MKPFHGFMENHPIPQDVTGFQFKLIGSMTVKQFGYVAAGGVLAVIVYYLPLFLLIKIIFVPLFILAGVSFAFLPVEGRPMDMMLSYFIKALFSPDQYVFSKAGARLALSTLSLHKSALPTRQPVHPTKTQRAKIPPSPTERKEQLATYLSHLPKHMVSKFDEKEEAYMQSLFQKISLMPSPQDVKQIESPTLPITPEHEMTQAPTHVVTAEIFEDRAKPISYEDNDSSQPTKDAELSSATKDESNNEDGSGEEKKEKQKAEDLEQKLENAKQNEKNAETKKEAEENHKKVLDLSSELQAMMTQKQKLEEELLKLKKDMEKKEETTVAPVALKEPEKKAPLQAQESQFVHKVPKNLAKAKGIPIIPDSPNVVAGVVKDARENVLPNILVEIKDKDGNPIRAFKTNQFGQFVSATALANGTYTVVLEDPKGKHTFDSIELVATGDILLPLEIISHDAREALRKELFS